MTLSTARVYGKKRSPVSDPASEKLPVERAIFSTELYFVIIIASNYDTYFTRFNEIGRIQGHLGNSCTSGFINAQRGLNSSLLSYYYTYARSRVP